MPTDPTAKDPDVPAEPLDVEVPAELVTGTYSNAFRVVDEAGPDCFLDFLVYAAGANVAKVVSRVRIRRAFIDSVRDSLAEARVQFREDLVVGEDLSH